MTTHEFLDKCEESFPGKPYTIGQRAAFDQKLERFTETQVMGIYAQILENCKYAPRIADVYDAAQELGYLSIDATQFRSHQWEPSNECGLCRGEGRLAIFWRVAIQERDTGLVEFQEIVHVAQYTKSFDRHIPSNEFRSVFRCKCRAGDVATIPKHWPKLSKETPTSREIWL